MSALSGWKDIAVAALVGDIELDTVYLEFVNSTTSIVPPSFGASASDSRLYYDSLGGGARDYVRVRPTAKVSPGGTVTFSAATVADTGVHGLPFSFAANSRIVGGALAASHPSDDPTRDRLFSRFYYPQEEQKPLPADSQLSLDYRITL